MSKWLVPLVCILPGSACTFFIVKSTKWIPRDLEKIYKLEKEYGGCKFWFVKSTSDESGWHSHEAIHSATLRNDVKLDKVRRLIEQLNYSENDNENNAIKTKCQEKKNELVELVWGSSDKWTVSSDDWSNKKHSKTTD